MVTNILVFLWIVLIVVILWYSVKRIHHDAYSFQQWEKVETPYIVIDAQGQKLNMLVDSGAAVSIIKKSVLETLPSYEKSTRRVSLNALTTDSLDDETVIIPFTVKGREVKSDFTVYDGEIGGFSWKYGVEIHGLLGAEFLKKTKGIIDFNSQTVIFP